MKMICFNQRQLEEPQKTPKNKILKIKIIIIITSKSKPITAIKKP